MPNTPKRVPIEAFLRKVEEDRDYFFYFDLDEEEAMNMAIKRAAGLLEEAINRIMLECYPDVDFTERDPKTGDFTFEWTAREKILVPSLMYEAYLERDIAALKLKEVNYTDTYLRVFDPSNARSSFLSMYDRLHEYNLGLIDMYKSTDRLTGALKGIDFDLYDEEA